MSTNYWISTSSGDYGDIANWSLGAVPTTGDDVVIPAGTAAITTNLNQSAVAIGSFRPMAGCGSIGTATAPLQLRGCPSDINFGYDGSQTLAGRIHIDYGSAVAAAIVVHAGSQASTDAASGLYATRIKSANASSTLSVLGGDVDVAMNTPGETATFATISATKGPGTSINPRVRISSGVTLTTFNSSGGGEHIVRCALTTLQNDGGNVRTEGSGAITTMNCTAGTITPNSTGTVTNMTAEGSGSIDMLRSRAARTVTTPTIKNGGTISADSAYVTFTNKLAFTGRLRITAAAA